MKITKFIKDKNNKYKVIIDGDVYLLYDDVILKYSLGLKSDIDDKLLNEVIEYNDFLKYYYLSLKYISTRMRCKKEIITYLEKKEIDKNIISNVIDKLYKDNYLNDYLYVKSYINDSFNLSDKGPLKIRSELLKLDLPNELIEDTLDSILNSINLNKRIDTIIEKKVRLNRDKGINYLKRKILLDLTNLGYNKETILDRLNLINIDDSDIYKKEKEKAYNKYKNKYSGYELECKVKTYLYRKGFNSGGFYED